MLIDEFEREVECEYKGEIYSVRDNGSIKRHPKEGKKPRPFDDFWTFGDYDPKDGYAKLCGQTVHRIVAFAFLGEPPTPQHVIDHIDTNRRNNRPENLRWVTKLENVLLNPLTRKKLELICGCPVEEILKDWSILRDKKLDTNFTWMHAVTKEEAANTLKSWNKWVEEGTVVEKRRPKLPVFFRQGESQELEGNPYMLEPKSEIASLEEYCRQLEIGKVFYQKRRYDSLEISQLIDFYYDKNDEVIYYACKNLKNSMKKYFFGEITITENKFRYSGRSLFERKSVDKYMTLVRGQEWTGGDTIDDYC